MKMKTSGSPRATLPSGRGAGAVTIRHPNAGQTGHGQRPAGLGHEIHADQCRKAETRQRSAEDSTRCQEASGDDLVRSLHLVPSGVGIVVRILVGEVGAALHQDRTDQHQDEQEGVKRPRLRG